MVELTEKCPSEFFDTEHCDNRLERRINSQTGPHEVGDGADVDFEKRKSYEESDWAVHHYKREKSLEIETRMGLESRKILGRTV